MKKIVLPKVEFTVGAKKVKAAEQLRLLLMMQPPENTKFFTIEEMRLRIPVIDKLEKAENDVLLEDNEHGLLVNLINNATWGGVNRDAVTLADAVVNAQNVEVKEKKGK